MTGGSDDGCGGGGIGGRRGLIGGQGEGGAAGGFALVRERGRLGGAGVLLIYGVQVTTSIQIGIIT